MTTSKTSVFRRILFVVAACATITLIAAWAEQMLGEYHLVSLFEDPEWSAFLDDFDDVLVSTTPFSELVTSWGTAVAIVLCPWLVLASVALLAKNKYLKDVTFRQGVLIIVSTVLTLALVSFCLKVADHVYSLQVHPVHDAYDASWDVPNIPDSIGFAPGVYHVFDPAYYESYESFVWLDYWGLIQEGPYIALPIACAVFATALIGLELRKHSIKRKRDGGESVARKPAGPIQPRGSLRHFLGVVGIVTVGALLVVTIAPVIGYHYAVHKTESDIQKLIKPKPFSGSDRLKYAQLLPPYGPRKNVELYFIWKDVVWYDGDPLMLGREFLRDVEGIVLYVGADKASYRLPLFDKAHIDRLIENKPKDFVGDTVAIVRFREDAVEPQVILSNGDEDTGPLPLLVLPKSWLKETISIALYNQKGEVCKAIDLDGE